MGGGVWGGRVPGEVSGAAMKLLLETGNKELRAGCGTNSRVLSPEGICTPSLLDAVGYAFSLKCSASLNNIQACAPLKSCLPATLKGIKGMKWWLRACVWGWTSEKERACKCFINFTRGSSPG